MSATLRIVSNVNVTVEPGVSELPGRSCELRVGLSGQFIQVGQALKAVTVYAEAPCSCYSRLNVNQIAQE